MADYRGIAGEKAHVWPEHVQFASMKWELTPGLSYAALYIRGASPPLVIHVTRNGTYWATILGAYGGDQIGISQATDDLFVVLDRRRRSMREELNHIEDMIGR